MKLNLTKCTFGIVSNNFFNFMVIHHEIKVNPEKIRAIMEISSPKIQKKVQCLIERVAALNGFVVRLAEKVSSFLQGPRNLDFKPSLAIAQNIWSDLWLEADGSGALVQQCEGTKKKLRRAQSLWFKKTSASGLSTSICQKESGHRVKDSTHSPSKEQTVPRQRTSIHRCNSLDEQIGIFARRYKRASVALAFLNLHY